MKPPRKQKTLSLAQFKTEETKKEKREYPLPQELAFVLKAKKLIQTPDENRRFATLIHNYDEKVEQNKKKKQGKKQEEDPFLNPAAIITLTGDEWTGDGTAEVKIGPEGHTEQQLLVKLVAKGLYANQKIGLYTHHSPCILRNPRVAESNLHPVCANVINMLVSQAGVGNTLLPAGAVPAQFVITVYDDIYADPNFSSSDTQHQSIITHIVKILKQTIQYRLDKLASLALLPFEGSAKIGICELIDDLTSELHYCGQIESFRPIPTYGPISTFVFIGYALKTYLKFEDNCPIVMRRDLHKVTIDRARKAFVNANSVMLNINSSDKENLTKLLAEALFWHNRELVFDV